MTEMTKQEVIEGKMNTPPEKCENTDEENWSKDQREKSYYYDDSYGYEIYNPDEDDDEDDASETTSESLKCQNPTKL